MEAASQSSDLDPEQPPPGDGRSESRRGLRTKISSRLRRIRSLFGGEGAYVLVLAAIVGTTTGFGALGFRALVDGVIGFTFGGLSVLDEVGHLSWPMRLGLPVVGMLIAWCLTQWFAKEAKGHGVPEVMEAVLRGGGKIRPRVVLVKSLASAMTIGTGGSVGREGPIVQIGSALGSVIGQLLRLDAQRVRLLVACGAAAGIAGTFNAPMAGVLFAVEIILGSASVRTFSPIVVSAVTATAVTRGFLGDDLAFQVAAYTLESPGELFVYVLLGLASGLIGVAFIRFLYWTEDLFDKLPLPGFLVPILGGLLVGALGLVVPDIYGLGYDSVEKALHDDMALQALLLLVVAKMAATSLTLAGGGSGGIFAPSLFLGAMLGGAVGIVAGAAGLWPTASPAAYALVGMAGVVSAATHAPLTAIVIIFELTGHYEVILPLMLTSIIASVLSVTIQRKSIYTLKLARRGMETDRPAGVSALMATSLNDLMSKARSIVRPKVSFDELGDHVLNSEGHYHYVVDEDEQFLGVILLEDIKSLLKEDALSQVANAHDAMNRDIEPMKLGDTVEQCLAHFADTEHSELPVVGPDGKLAGVIRRQDILGLYNRELLSNNDLGLMFVSRGESAERHDYVELPPGFDVAAIGVPAEFVGKTLHELELRQRHGLLVVTVRCPGEDGIVRVAPDPKASLERGMVLVVEGPKEGIAWLRTLAR